MKFTDGRGEIILTVCGCSQYPFFSRKSAGSCNRVNKRNRFSSTKNKLLSVLVLYLSISFIFP
jgi:hypothetical protein